METTLHVQTRPNKIQKFWTKQRPKVSFSNTKDIVFYGCSEIILTRNLTIFFYLGFLSQPLTNHRTAGKEKGISLTPHYYFHPLRRHLDISRAITAESSPLHIGSSWTRTKNLYDSLSFFSNYISTVQTSFYPLLNVYF